MRPTFEERRSRDFGEVFVTSRSENEVASSSDVEKASDLSTEEGISGSEDEISDDSAEEHIVKLPRLERGVVLFSSMVVTSSKPGLKMPIGSGLSTLIVCGGDKEKETEDRFGGIDLRSMSWEDADVIDVKGEDVEA